MRHLIRVARAPALGGLIVTGLIIVPSAHAQNNQPQPQPSIAFLDERPLTVNFDSIKEAKGKVRIEIRNNDPEESQDVTLRLVGLESPTGKADPAVSGIVPDPITQTVKPLHIETFVLTFNTDDRPATGSYEGLLVATARSEVIRRTLTIEVQEIPSPAQGRIDVTVIPERLATLTLVGTNYLPSLLSPLLPTFFCLFVAGLLVLAAVSLGRRSWWLAVFSSVGLLILLGLGSAFSLGRATVDTRDWWPGPVLRHVVVNSVPIPTQVSRAALGTVAAADGSLGMLVGEGTFLDVEGILRAGKYEGKIDLVPETDKGDVGVVVNVRDWWPFAFFTIAMGVCLGYWITRYYKQRRGAEEHRVRAARLRVRILTAEAEFQRKHNGLPFAQYSMANLAEQFIKVAEEDLDKPDTEAANKRLTALEDYEKRFNSFRRNLAALHELASQVWQQMHRFDDAVDRSQVDVLQDADELLAGKAFNLEEDEDEQGAELTRLQNRVQPLMERLEALEEIHGWLIARLDAISRALRDADVLLRPKLEAKRQRLEDLIPELLSARQTTELEELKKVANKIWDEDPRVRMGRSDSPQLDTPVLSGEIIRAPELRGTGSSVLPQQAVTDRNTQGAWQTYDRLRTGFRRRELKMTLITGLLAVTSGLSVLYFTNASWGAPGDYLTAFLWALWYLKDSSTSLV